MHTYCFYFITKQICDCHLHCSKHYLFSLCLWALYSFLLIFLTFILPLVNCFNPTWVLRLKVANKSHYYHYSGLMENASIHGFPKAKVKYNDGKFSKNMAIGNAVDYADMFGG